MPVKSNVKFRIFAPDNGVGQFFYGQIPLIFSKPDDKISTDSLPNSYQKNIDNTALQNSISRNMVYTRLVYFAFLADGSILTLTFQKIYSGDPDALDWAKGKINSLDCFKGDEAELIKYFNGVGSEGISRGLDQDFNGASIVFFFVYNREMKFYKKKFSMIPVGSQQVAGNPFHIIASTDSNFFALYNDFTRNSSSTRPYVYKFNLHMQTKGAKGDTPSLIPFVIDPDVRNDGPPR